MYISGISASRKRTLQLQMLTTYAAVRPQIHMRRANSDLSAYFSSAISLNSGSSSDSTDSDTCSPKSPEAPKISLEQKAKLKDVEAGKPGFKSLLPDQDAPPQPTDQDKSKILGHQLKVDVSNASGLGKPLNPAGTVEFGSHEISRLRGIHPWPCIFAPTSEPSAPLSFSSDLIIKPDSVPDSEIKGHAIISPDGDLFLRPPTYCTVHKNSGYLRVEDIQDSESYTRVESRFPCIKVTHIFDDCILEFPPPGKLIGFKKNKKDDHDQADDNSPPPPPIKKVDHGPSSSTHRPLPDYFLRNCLNCYKRLYKKEIYMYRGDSWFCCEDCRHLNTAEGQEQSRLALARFRAKVQQQTKARIAENRRKMVQAVLTSSKNKGKAVLN